MNNNRLVSHVICFSRIAVIVSIFLVPFVLVAERANAEEELTYSMSRGDNLWNITERYLDNGFHHWNALIRHNNVTDPTIMSPGTEIQIPLSWLKIDPATVQVRAIHGHVQYLPANTSNLKTLSNDTLLKDGDKIIVGEEANVVLEFSDRSRLFLASGSEMELVKINKFSDSGLADTKVKLKKGRTETKVKTKNTRFQIKTPSANTTVRGTDFRVTVDNKNPAITRVEVLEGLVSTANNSNERNVKAGFGTLVEKDGTPHSLIKLLSKPEILSPPNYSRQLPVDLKWKQIEGAVQYRLQIYQATDKKTLLFDKIIPINRFNTSALEDDKYLVIVRAIDSKGLEGLNAEYLLHIDARPQPPLPITPKDDETVRLELPEFEWSAPIDSTSYHFILSEHPDLTKPIINNTEFTETKFTPEQLSPGKYYWQLATLTGNKKGPFGQIHNFTLKPAPKAPDLSEMSSGGDETNLTLRWQSGTEGQQYKIQFASDPEFKNILIKELLASPEFTTDRFSQIMYLRIKVIDVDGFEGDWSPAQQIEPLPDPWYTFLIPTVPFLTLFLLAL